MRNFSTWLLACFIVMFWVFRIIVALMAQMRQEFFVTPFNETMEIILLFVVFYFFLIRPQKKRDKAEKEMRDSIKVGDEISTIGGFIGKVVSIKDDTLVIESTADRTKLKLYRWAVRGKEASPADKIEENKETK